MDGVQLKSDGHPSGVRQSYLDAAVRVIRDAKAASSRSVNLAMTYAYFEVGRIVVEEEQAGKDRAEYGGQVIANVSERLINEFGRGFSKTNVKQMRRFYLTYADDAIGQTASDQLGAHLPATTNKSSQANTRRFCPVKLSSRNF